MDVCIKLNLCWEIFKCLVRQGRCLNRIRVERQISTDRLIRVRQGPRMQNWNFSPRKNQTKESFISARDELCEISSHFAAVHSGFYATDDSPRKCLKKAGGKCNRGGLCKVGCGEGGYCCSRFLIHLNSNCPAGWSSTLGKWLGTFGI